MRLLVCALFCGLLVGNANAQSAAPCDDISVTGSRLTTRDTDQASDKARELVRKGGPDADLRSIRRRVLKDEFPKADVEVTLVRMLREFCRVVMAAGDIPGDQKVARVQAAQDDLLKPVQGPTELARTNPRSRQSSSSQPAIRLVAWSSVDVAQAYAKDDRFLRSAPAYVNDSNRWFVIVGSPRSEAEAIGQMNRLKAKAPQHDFVVYGPYGQNPYYSIMMATWVSREVGEKALRAAKADVSADAYLWRCPSSGESC